MKNFKFQKQTLIVLLVHFLWLTFSFSQNHYEPNNGILTNLKKPHQLTVITSFSKLNFSKPNYNYDIQGGYSPIKGLGIQVGYASNESSNFNKSILKRSLLQWNTAVGLYRFTRRKSLFKRKYRMQYPSDYYFARQKFKMKTGFLLEAYLGYGQLSAKNNLGEVSNSNFKFNKRYGQVGFTWFDKFWGVGYYFRVGQLYFNNIQAELIGPRYASLKYTFEKIVKDNPYTLKEHTLQIFIGTRKVKLTFNYNYLFKNSSFSHFGITNHNFKVGINVRLDNFFNSFTYYKSAY